MRRRAFVALALAAAFASIAGAADPSWRSLAPLPTPRTEVAGAVVAGEIAVAGGYLADGSDSREVDLYSPARNTWRRAAPLPIGVDHAMAATLGGRLVVVGGYASGSASRSGFVLDAGRWKALPRLPSRRAAGGAAVVGGKLYVISGGPTPGGSASVANEIFAP